MSDDISAAWRIRVLKLIDAETVELVVEQEFHSKEQAEDSMRFMERIYRPPGFRIQIVEP